MVVIPDGVDTASAKTPDAVLERSRALDVPIYALSVVSPLDDPSSPRYLHKARGQEAEGARTLARYAALSGGDAFQASSWAGLRTAAFQIARELKHQYRLGYEPPAGPAGFRRVEVRATRKGVTVRTRRGYVPPTREANTPARRSGPAPAAARGKEGKK